MYKKVDELIKTWENFMTNPEGKGNLQSFVRSDILNSWSRCQSVGLNPEQNQAKSVLTTLELENLLSESQLFHVAKPIMDNIYEKLMGTGYLITLNDEQGKMIYLKGEPDIIRKTEKMNFSPGMDWSENAAGTNAIGTSIVSKKPIQVFSAEHFCKGFHPMTCSSAPIFHPYTKKVIGAIDFTGLWQSTQPHTLGLAVSLAKVIEQELHITFQKKYHFLEEFYRHCKNKWKDNPILVLSDESVIVNGDHVLLEISRLKKMTPIEENPQIISTSIKEKVNAEESISKSNLIRELKKNGFLLIHVEPILYNNEAAGTLVVFRDKNNYHRNGLKQEEERTIIGNSSVMQNILHKCHQIASVEAPILLTGETGTGKELIARYLHKHSSRRDKPFIAINCGSISKELIGSELFGYEGGTFTGGKRAGKSGKFEEANGGTIFLDEIGEMPIDLQVHLLRVLQEKEVTRLGSVKTLKIDVKVIAATNRDVGAMVEDGLFRNDLFFRLNVISLTVPPLRERQEDILPITEYYLSKFARKYKKMHSFHLNEELKHFFMNYTWPGNIRELRNVLEHAVIFSNLSEIERKHLPEYLATLETSTHNNHKEHTTFSLMEKTEVEQIKKLLIQTGWNKTAVSKELNIARSTLYRKLKKDNLEVPLNSNFPSRNTT